MSLTTFTSLPLSERRLIIGQVAALLTSDPNSSPILGLLLGWLFS